MPKIHNTHIFKLPWLESIMLPVSNRDEECPVMRMPPEHRKSEEIWADFLARQRSFVLNR